MIDGLEDVDCVLLTEGEKLDEAVKDGDRDSIDESEELGVTVDERLGEFVPELVRDVRPVIEIIDDAEKVRDEIAD